MKKQMYVGIKILENALPMTAEEAKEKAYLKSNYEGESEGYEVTYEGGFQSWSPKTVFDLAYAKIGKAEEAVIRSFESPEDHVKGMVALSKVQACVAKVGGAEWSLKSFAKETLKIFGHKF